jgi:hypothetical protein
VQQVVKEVGGSRGQVGGARRVDRQPAHGTRAAQRTCHQAAEGHEGQYQPGYGADAEPGGDHARRRAHLNGMELVADGGTTVI